MPSRRQRSRLSFESVLAVVVIVLSFAVMDADAAVVRIGSKRFTESYILAEVVRQTLLAHGIDAVHRAGLGNTGILVAALDAGEIDLYPEYTGTIVREILKETGEQAAEPTLESLNRALAGRGLKVAVPFGFSDSYALAMRQDEAARRGIVRLSDLADPDKARGLRLGLSNEFLARGDGWPALKAAYRLPLETPSGLDHGLAYDALADRRVDVIDIYSTDARIGRDGVRVLQDDRHFFPAYQAVLLMRTDYDPQALQALSGTIDNRTMIALNARAELDHVPFADVAAGFLADHDTGRTTGVPPTPRNDDRMRRFFHALFGPDFWRLLSEHVVLVAGSVLAATIVAVPLGVWSARRPVAGRVILNVVGVLQTIPSLALLALLIAVLGTIGTVPALVALFLYALLPIVANTHAGLAGLSRGITQAAVALGLTARQQLAYVELPLAAPTIVTGIRTAAVINVGTATMAAFVGAGGFGERITAGLALNDGTTMLTGAIPAAVLALVVQFGFDALARVVDRGRSQRR